MPTYFVVCYIISLALSVITLLAGIFVGIKRSHTIRILPRALRLYLSFCCYPYFLSTSICSIYIACFYLLYNTQTHYTIEIFRIIITFSSQQVRNSFTFIVIERIVATKKLENYIQASELRLFWKLTFITYVISAFYMGYTTLGKNLPDFPIVSNLATYFVYCAHVFMLSVCAILYLMNRRMYKLSAYRINLKKRYMIAQNIKCLSYLFPSLLIYSVFAQFGSMISIIFQALNFPAPPVSVFHIFYNFSFLLIYLRHYCIQSNNNNIPNFIKVTTVQNPLGKNIPTNLTSDQYFRDLRQNWT